MKKALIIFFSVIVFIFLFLLAAPFLFKDKIKAAVDKAIAENVNAHVYFDANNFSLSLLSNFPNVSVNLKDFGVVNKEPFKGDTLAAIKEFDIVVDIMSVISGDKMKIKSVLLDEPRLFVQVTKDGKASWDIAKPSTDTAKATPTEESSAFSLSIEQWEIKSGYVVYDDKSSPLYAKVVNLNHTGSGDLQADIFDMVTKTTSDEVTVTFDTVTYLNQIKFDADMTLNMDMKNSKYTFKDNKFLINAFAFGFDGSVAMPADGSMLYDIIFAAKETQFKNFLSLVPGVFTKDFEKLKTDGVLAFDGYYKGVQKDSTKMPGFGLNLKIDKGMFQYPDLPTAVTNVFVDLNVDNKDGVLDNIVVNLKKMHIDMGANPIDARVYMAGLTNMKVDADVNAKLNLNDVSKIYPVEGLLLKGLFALNVKAKGIYNEKEKKMPTVVAGMNLTNGYAKSKDFPKPLENINMAASVSNPTGVLNDTKANLEKLSFLLDGEPLNASGNFSNFDDVNYDAKLNGVLDLGKLTKIFPLDSMTLTGRIIADIATKGKMSLVTSGKYNLLSTSGKMDFKNFEYKSFDLPQGFKITEGSMSFTPEKINITQLNGFLGKSDIDIKGYVANYMGYAFSNGTVKGQMNFVSNTFDVNEWMVEDPSAAKAKPQETQPTTAPEVPKNIDFVLSSVINKVEYSNYGITNLKGDIIVRDGAVTMKQLGFNMIDGTFLVNGSYDAKNIETPKFGFDFNMQNASIPKAYSTFNTVQAFAPVAKNIVGTASMKFAMSGDLKKNMDPVLPSVNGKGVVTILDAKITQNTLLDKLAELTKNNSLKNPTLQNTQIQAEIKDGKLTFKPFDLKAGDVTANIGGGQGLDGSLDYALKVDLPAGQLGTAAAQSLGKLAGVAINPIERVQLSFKVGGTSDNPKITPTGASTSGKGTQASPATQVKEQVQQKVEEQVQQKKEEVQKQAEEKAKEEAGKQIKDIKKKWGL